MCVVCVCVCVLVQTRTHAFTSQTPSWFINFNIPRECHSRAQHIVRHKLRAHRAGLAPLRLLTHTEPCAVSSPMHLAWLTAGLYVQQWAPAGSEGHRSALLTPFTLVFYHFLTREPPEPRLIVILFLELFRHQRRSMSTSGKSHVSPVESLNIWWFHLVFHVSDWKTTNKTKKTFKNLRKIYFYTNPAFNFTKCLKRRLAFISITRSNNSSFRSASQPRRSNATAFAYWGKKQKNNHSCRTKWAGRKKKIRTWTHMRWQMAVSGAFAVIKRWMNKPLPSINSHESSHGRSGLARC